MPALKLVRLGHPALRQVSARVSATEIKQTAFQKFLDDLVITCDKNDGVGIAAPQVGVNKRVIVVHVDPNNPRYKSKPKFETAIVINPRVVEKSRDQKDDWEGDLSCGFRAAVPRAKWCKVEGLNRDGMPVSYNLQNDFHARVFQHEIDHLNGKFFIDKVKRYETISEVAEWKKYWKNRDLSG